MTIPAKTLAELLGSRICHDLISPIGAIGNGLELLTMSGAGAGPEMSLINDSLVNANARIRFYRVAFGTASEGQLVSRQEIISLLSDLTRGSRMRIDWQSGGDLSRTDAKLLFLLIQCCESAMPYGGDVEIAHADGQWQITACAGKIKDLGDLWDHLNAAAAEPALTPSQVHFGLAGHMLKDSGRRLEINHREDRIAIRLM